MTAGQGRRSAEAMALTVEDVAAALGDVCPGVRVDALRPGPHSYSNRLWVAESDEGPLLVRVPGRTADPEYVRGGLVAARLAAEAGIGAPRLRAFARETALGLPMVVQEFRPGEPATAALRRGAADLAEVAAHLGDLVGRLHAIHRDGCGSVVGAAKQTTGWRECVAAKVSDALATVDATELPLPRADVESAFEDLLARLPGPAPASLVHSDLYLDNVLVHRGAVVSLLDFEHAAFQDRFAEFGKLNELVFEGWPGSQEPFLAAYRAHFPADEGDAVRRRLGVGLHELTYLAYFRRWQPDLVPVYQDRLRHWLAHR